jgi:hypothetical protein
VCRGYVVSSWDALQVRSRTSRWGLGTSSARALRFDRVDKVFNRTADNPPDTDPAFDPEADAARIRAETAARAQVVCFHDDIHFVDAAMLDVCKCPPASMPQLVRTTPSARGPARTYMVAGALGASTGQSKEDGRVEAKSSYHSRTGQQQAAAESGACCKARRQRQEDAACGLEARRQQQHSTCKIKGTSSTATAKGRHPKRQRHRRPSQGWRQRIRAEG